VALLAFIKYLVLSRPQFLAYSKLFQRHLVLIQIICVLSYFQEGKSLQESIKKISENLTKLREEINRTQQHLLKSVSFVGPIKQFFYLVLDVKYDSMSGVWNVLQRENSRLIACGLKLI